MCIGVYVMNMFLTSGNLIILVSIHLLIHLSTHLSHRPHSRHPLLFHSRLKTYLLNKSSHRRFLLATGLPHDNGTGADLSRSSFYFQFHNFVFILCGRLSWLPVSFLLHVKYTLSYRIIIYIIVCKFYIYIIQRICMSYQCCSYGNIKLYYDVTDTLNKQILKNRWRLAH